MEYTLKRVKRSRSIRVRVEATGVVVTASPYIPRFMIERFVKQQEPWIKRQQAKNKLRTEVFPTFDWENKVVSYKGKLYDLRIIHRQDSGQENYELSIKKRISINTNKIEIVPITGKEIDAKKMLVSWLKREGEDYILSQLPDWAEKMKVRYGSVRFRQQKSRWGSCSGRGNLSFNWRLIHFKQEVINYVIVHELAHIKHHDHSKEFWATVADYEPRYKEHVRFLKRVQLQLI